MLVLCPSNHHSLHHRQRSSNHNIWVPPDEFQATLTAPLLPSDYFCNHFAASLRGDHKGTASLLGPGLSLFWVSRGMNAAHAGVMAELPGVAYAVASQPRI